MIVEYPLIAYLRIIVYKNMNIHYIMQNLFFDYYNIRNLIKQTINMPAITNY